MAAKLSKMEPRELAALLKSECLHSTNGTGRLIDFLNSLLRLQTPMKDLKLNVIEQLIAGDMTFQDFSRTVKKYDDSAACGLVWTADFVAYRCRTCGISPCMSICADCFHGGDHEGHDFNMFRSLAGGACDCGDSSVMKATGFCSNHSPNRPQKALSVPKHLTVTAEVVIPRLLWRLVQHFRTNYTPIALKFNPVVIQSISPVLDLLDKLSKLGGAMRRVIVDALLEEEIYAELMKVTSLDEQLQRDGCLAYHAAMNSLSPPDFSPLVSPVPDFPALDSKLRHHNFVGELLFWTAVYNFPQEMITFLLSMLPDNVYKEKFTTIFLKHYVRIAMTLKGRTNPNHVVHISVQLFSNEALASKMVREMGLLHVLCLSGLSLLQPALVTSPLMGNAMAALPPELADKPNRVHKVLNCDNRILKDQRYWPIVSDFANILSHRSVATYFYKDKDLMQLWCRFITMFMGMNLNKRELGYHIEFEPNSYSTAFAAEIEGCAAPMWQIASHCQDKTTMCHTLSFIRELQVALVNWLESLNMDGDLHPLQASFHIPLIRYLSVFLQHGVNEQGMSLSMLMRTPPQGMSQSKSFIRTPTRLKKLMMFPLQIMAVISEVYCGMWVRNGLQMKCQAMTYLQCHFSASMADLDLYFLQVCVALLESTGLTEDEFVKIVLDRFKVSRWVTFDPGHSPFNMDSNQEMAMLEAALTFIATLVSVRTNLGMSSEETLRKEMVTLLCIEDRTYSKLQDKIPDKTGVINTNIQFEKTLKEIADYQLPTSDIGGLQQGKYSPKAEVWENEFDPLHVMFRSMERKEFQLAMDNYTAYLKKAGHYKEKAIPWPPFQPLKPIHKEYGPLRKILNCRTLHAVIYAVLYKAVHSAVMSEASIYMSVALISMALQCGTDEEDCEEISSEEPVSDDKPDSWFCHKSILGNLYRELSAVRYQVNAQKVNPYEKETGAKQVTGTASGTSQFLVSLMMDGQWVELLNTQGPGAAAPDPNDEWVNILTNMIQTGEPTVEEVPMEVDNPGPPEPPDLLNLDEQSKQEEETNAKRQRKETPPPEFVTKPLNESMISLLVKLYAKLSHKEVNYLPPSVLPEGEVATRKVLHGQGPVYIKDILDQVYLGNHRCKRLLDKLCEKSHGESEEAQLKQSSPGTIESRKRRSMEAKQRMIAKLALQQKQFLASAFSGEQEADGAGEIDMDIKLPEYECVICSQVEATTEENPYGLCVLLQTTKVLGHRSQSSEMAMLPLSEKEPLTTGKKCYQMEASRWADATARFDKASCLSSFGVSWESGVHAQTCGHYVHIKCMKSFTESIGAHDMQARHLHVNGGEYECPICRQLANTILPCSVQRAATSMSKYSCKELSKLSLQISKRLGSATRQLSLGKTDFENGVFKFVEDIFRQLPMEVRKAARADEGGPFAYLCSLARTNIELHLVRLGGTLVTTGASSEKKSFLGVLMDIFSCYLEKMSKIPLLPTWQRIVGLHKLSKSDADGYIPVLVQDPVTLLFLLMFHLPQPITNDHLICLIYALYNLVHVQALTRIACKLSPTDRSVFLRPAERSRQSEVSVLLGHIIQHLTHLRHGWLYADPSELEDVCVSVWSPLAIDAFVKQECLPFMRVAALLQHAMFDVPLPIIEKPESEFTSLLQHLHLSSPPAAGTHIQRFSMHSPQSLQVTQGNPLALVRLWCEEFNHFLLKCYAQEKSIRVPQNLLLFSPVFNLPRLIRLPESFSQLFEFYRRQVCRKCNSKPQKPMICLVCARLICWSSDCCVLFRGGRKYGEGISHAKECGSGAAIYLDVDSSLTVLIQGQRICRWASLYLDSHGEEDRELRRGKPLFLSQQRFDLLEQLWQSVKLKHFCKGWEWHLGGHE